MRRLLIAAAPALLGLAAACSGKGSNHNIPAPLLTATPACLADSGNCIAISNGILATTNRDHLGFCLSRFPEQSVANSDIDKLANAILAADRSLNGFDGAKRYFDTHSVKADDCPPPPVPLGRRQVSKYHASEYAGRVAIPSVHRVFVYFVSKDVYTATFGAEPYVAAAAEMLCSGDNCAEVTTAIYTTRAVSDRELAAAILRALGLYEACERLGPCS